jgi:protein-S-isoprenylcysteine O-methyltransferase Ste14
MHKSASLITPGSNAIVQEPLVQIPLPVATAPPGLATHPAHLKQSLIYRWRSVICSIIVFGTWGISLVSGSSIAMGSWPERFLTACGWACFTVGVFIRFWATLYIGGRKSTSIICQGPYSITRNPLYWGTMLVLVSQGFFYHNLIFALGLIPPFFIYYFGVIPAEERHLLVKFGDDYRAYCEAVPRIGPRFSRYRSPREVVVSMRGLHAETLRVLGWIWLPILAQVINALRETPNWPRLF